MLTRTRTRTLVAAGSLSLLVVALGIVPVAAGAAPAAPSDSAASAAPKLTATALTPTGRVQADKSPSSALARTPKALLDRTDSAPVSVMIKFDYDPSATYAGGVRGLAPTSPLETGKALTGKSAPERAYAGYVAKQETTIVKGLRTAVPGIKVGQSFRTVYGGVAATIPASAVESVLAVDGVVAVLPDRLRQPLTDSSPEFVNAPPVYDELGGAAQAGEGVIYGNLDTGIWPEHPSFADLGTLGAPPVPATGPRVCNFGDNPLTPAADPFVCQNKLIGGQPFLTTYLSDAGRAAAEPFHTARDSNGHGTHTSSTSAGNIVDNATVFGVQRGPIQGLAPGAWVMEYKVCGIEGCFDSDTAAAVQQAIFDQVDVINFSISGGTDPFADPTELAFLDAYAAGVFVSASAGNDGPGAGTANHLAPWVTTVGASTQTREFASTLSLTADNGDVFTADGASITAGAGPLPVVLSSAAPYSNQLCDAPAAPGTFTGKLVVCVRGVNARVEKGFNVLQGGAAGMILVNPTLADTETDNHWLPTVHLPDGTDLLAFFAGHTGITGSFTAGTARDGQGDVMGAFSSRGPAGLVIKPDLTAPGVQILAGHTPFREDILGGPPGEMFQAIAGTSMSSPHVAGAAILLRAAKPDWTPGQIKSALMTSAVEDVVKEDLTTPADPFDMGAGRIDIGAAAEVSLTMDETARNFLRMSADPVSAVHLNIPSINAPVMPGRLVTTRTVTNPTDRRVVVHADALSPDDSAITVSPKRFTLRPGQSKTLKITITSDAPIGVQRFGSIVLDPHRGGTLHLPVAFVPTQGDVNLTQSCSPASIPKSATAVCTVEASNNSFNEQVVDLDTRTSKHLRVVSASGADVVSNRHVELDDVTLTPAQLGVPDVAPGSLFGYLPLSAFGVTPIVVGDEDIVDFDVPTFEYAGVSYNQLSVDTNGYLVPGVATSEDNNCCNLPTGPDPAAPNNMLAPFWTDLDGTGAPGIFAATLSDGVDVWIVIEFRVNVFGTASQRVFEVWLGTGGFEDITFAYDPANLPADPAGQDFLVGAENAAGAGDVVAVLPTEDLRVTSTPPTPGGSVSYTVTVRGQHPGTGAVTTEMTATGIPGVTVVRSEVVVLAS